MVLFMAARVPAEVNPSGNRHLAPGGSKGVSRSSRKRVILLTRNFRIC